MSHPNDPFDRSQTSSYQKTNQSWEAPPRAKVPRRRSGWSRFVATVLTAAIVGGLAGAGVSSFFMMRQPAPATSGSASSEVRERVVQMDTHGNKSITNIAEEVVPTVVGITNFGQVRDFFGSSRVAEQASGSGVILEEDGIIVTNFHVIANSTSISVKLNSGDQYDASVIGYDEATDIAVLKIDAKNLPAIEIGDSDEVRVGDLAVAVGNPLGDEFSQSVTDGIISGINRRLEQDYNAFELIQTNCAINSGNSGGALVDGQGRLIGINSAKILAAGVEGLGFAIPINNVMDIVKDIQTNGHVQRPYIGITGYSLTPELSAQLQVKDRDSGIIVAQVVEGGPADKAGIEANDVIYKADDTDIRSFDDLSTLLKSKKPGEAIHFYIDRDGKPVELDVTIGTQTSANS